MTFVLEYNYQSTLRMALTPTMRTALPSFHNIIIVHHICKNCSKLHVMAGETFHYQLSFAIYKRVMHLPLPTVHYSPSPVAGFLGMSDVHEYLVDFKWLWWHLAVNHHTTILLFLRYLECKINGLLLGPFQSVNY